jgi:hypothetical protein
MDVRRVNTEVRLVGFHPLEKFAQILKKVAKTVAKPKNAKNIFIKTQF